MCGNPKIDDGNKIKHTHNAPLTQSSELHQPRRCHAFRDVLATAADFDRAPDSGASARAPAGAPADDERTIDLRRCISALCSAFAARSAAFISTLRACVKKSFAALFEMFSMRYVLPKRDNAI